MRDDGCFLCVMRTHEKGTGTEMIEARGWMRKTRAPLAGGNRREYIHASLSHDQTAKRTAPTSRLSRSGDATARIIL